MANERFGGWPLLNHTVKSTANLPAESDCSFLTTVFSFFLPHKSEKCKDVLCNASLENGRKGRGSLLQAGRESLHLEPVDDRNILGAV